MMFIDQIERDQLPRDVVDSMVNVPDAEVEIAEGAKVLVWWVQLGSLLFEGSSFTCAEVQHATGGWMSTYFFKGSIPAVEIGLWVEARFKELGILGDEQ